MRAIELIQWGDELTGKLHQLHRQFETSSAAVTADLTVSDDERAEKLSACRKVVADAVGGADAYLAEAGDLLREIGPKTAPTPSSDRLVRFDVLARFYVLPAPDRINRFRTLIEAGGEEAATLLDVVQNLQANGHPNQMTFPSGMQWLKVLPDDELQRGLTKWAGKYPRNGGPGYSELSAAYQRVSNHVATLKRCGCEGQPA